MEDYHLFYPRQVVLVSSRADGRDNVMPAAWATPVSFDPFLVAVAIGKERHTNKMIRKSGEFVLALATKKMEKTVDALGRCSGRDVDKFKKFGLKRAKASKVKAPLLRGFPVNVECKVVKAIDAGDHTLFVARVAAVHGKRGRTLFNAESGVYAEY